MNPTRSFAGLQAATGQLTQPLHLAIGMFDGVHLGHQAVVGSAVRSAANTAAESAVLTFWPHPSRLFRPEDPVRQLQSPEHRESLLLKQGVGAVITQPFTREFAALAPEDFLPYLKAALPNLIAIYVGENWRFGRGRRGDVSLLIEEGHKLGITVFSAPRVNHDGHPVSSTRIRFLVETGDIAQANTLLGYPYFSEGRIVGGKRLGRTIGFPTLNLQWSPELRPRLGVYTVRIKSEDTVNAPWLPAVANYGLRPTVEQSTEPRLEVHVVGPCPLGQGDHVRVEWLSFLRPEQTFDGIEALRKQIAADRAQAEAYFSTPTA